MVVGSDIENLVRLSHEIYTLKNHGKIPGKFRERLINPDQNSRGFRNELRIGAIFIESGFSIEWKKSKVPGEKIVEFDATDPSGKIVFSVESKRLESVVLENFKEKVSATIANAKSKNPIYPYIIFLDVNLPGMDFDEVMSRDYLKTEPLYKKTEYGNPVFIILTNLENNYHENWKSSFPSFLLPDAHTLLSEETYFISIGYIFKRLVNYPKIHFLETPMSKIV